MLIFAVKSALKLFRLSKREWNEIVQAVAYVKNRTISRSANSIISYKGVNKSILFIVHLSALEYCCYFHITDITIWQTMNGCRKKSILVRYEGVNQ